MGKINVLSFEIANLIAAGEVVERPSSVLKELIENSIDAGATEIVAEIKHGGVSLIRVTDNGCGIAREDLPVSLKRHATSKIKERDDLASIMTLGFRGEALAAISSVSSMTIISKTENEEEGSMLVAEAGNVVDISEVGCSNGTTVVVENLFYNVPARRKFLKKDSTEAMNVAALVEKIAISRPDISIQLLIDGQQRFKTSGKGDLNDTVCSVYGKDFASKVINVDGNANGIRVHGLIGRSDNVRKNRNMQNVFINGRYVKSLTVMAALEKAYTSYIAPECFPSCVLFLDMHPGAVDVNVHPAKLEVKFSDEKVVFESVYYTVKNALEEYEYRPELQLGVKRAESKNPISAFVPIGADTKGEQIGMDSHGFNTKTERAKSSFYDTNRKSGYSERDLDRPLRLSSGAGEKRFESSTEKNTMTPKDSIELLERYRNAAPSFSPNEKILRNKIEQSSDKKEGKSNIPEHKIIGEAFNCYVMVEYEGSLLIIDKHAAHERIIFEDLKKSRKNDGRVAYQTLILPITAILTPGEISALEEFSDEIKSLGFEFSLNGKAADITAIPDAITANDAETLFVKILDDITEGRGNPSVTESIRREKALYQIACKAAIKGGRIYNSNIIEWLVGRVLLLPDITVCPHGRPIAYKLTKSELDRQFERIK